jgi:hypothetical protein
MEVVSSVCDPSKMLGYTLQCGVKSIICSKQLHRNKHVPLDIDNMYKKCGFIT